MEIETVSTAGGAGCMDAVYSQEISALPEAVLIHVASFLPQIPLALFCVAMTVLLMTAESSAWRKADWNLPLSLASQKILLSREGMWDIHDFSQHDYALRWNLTDDDLGALLVVIDGRNKLKKLFLTETGPGPWKNGLSRITGYGLEPLRGSDVMVQIDIDCSYISEDVALSIIESFIENRQSSLRHIYLPEHWRKNSNLVSFLRRYDDFMYRLRFGCQQCGARVGRSRHNDYRIECIDDRGLQEITCYKCLSQFCTRCKTYDGEPVDPSFCNSCERFYCYGCASIDTCGGCGDQICEHCRGLDEECQGWECENPYFCVGCCEDESSNAAIVKVICARSVQVQQSVRGWIVSKYVVMIATVSLKWIPPRRNVESVSTRAARNVVGLGIKQVAMWSVKAAEAFFSLRLKRKM
eukprot:scaffold10235_cov131-Skeletonema_marinoi.AAC.10